MEESLLFRCVVVGTGGLDDAVEVGNGCGDEEIVVVVADAGAAEDAMEVE